MQRHSYGSNLYVQLIEVQKTLNDTSANYWTVLEILDYLNEAQVYIQRKSKVLQKRVDITTVASQREYDLRDNSFADIMDIDEDGVDFDINGSTTSNQPLEYYPIWKLNKDFSGWRGQSSSVPQYFYYKKASKTIGLFPKPNSSNSGAYLHVNGYYLPKVLISGTASSGSTTTLVMPSGSATLPYPSVTNDYYNGLYVEIYSGTGAGQKLEITDYVASTRTLTFGTATSPDSTSIFGIVPEIPEEAHYLMTFYALAKCKEKGGSRINQANNYWKQFYTGLELFMNEMTEENDEVLVKDSYR